MTQKKSQDGQLDIFCLDETGFSPSLPPTGRTGCPRIMVLDNASIHRSRTVRQARWELAERGIWLWYLPAYIPELNDIERTFRTVKHGGHAPTHLHIHRDADGRRGDRLSASQRTADTFRLSPAKCLVDPV